MNQNACAIFFTFAATFLMADPLSSAAQVNSAAQDNGARQPGEQANLWRCRSGETDRITITDSPSRIAGQSDKSGCEILDLSGSTFLRLPADQFHALGLNSSGLNTADIAVIEKEHPAGETGLISQSGKENRPPTRFNLNRITGEKPITSFNAKNISGGRGKNRRTSDSSPFDRMCEISGVARSEESAEAVIRIRRGALTTDDVPVKLSGNRKPVKWRTTLAGVCRNPEVTVVAE